MDIRAAFSWAEELPEGICKQDALAVIRLKWSAQNPEEASKQLGEMPAGDARNTLIQSVAERWALRDPMKALDWTVNLNGNERIIAISDFAGAWLAYLNVNNDIKQRTLAL